MASDKFTLVKMRFGSHVYGTSLPTSDTDIKSIYLPSEKEILLGKIQHSIHQSTKLESGRKNTAEDIDIELFSLQKYLDLLIQGQTVALDMLFTPKDFYLSKPHSLWNTIQDNKARFLHSGTAAFAGYCQAQAAKYSIKGSNLAAYKKAYEFFNSKPGNTRVEDHFDEMKTELIDQAIYDQVYHAQGEPIIKLVQAENHGKMETFLQVGKKTRHGMRVRCDLAADIWKRQLDQYGLRAKQAETNEGVDWKALMHAVRICSEAIELLLTAKITFPRPEAELLLKIRKGELPYKQVAEMIESGLEALTEAKKRSILATKPDKEYADEIVCAAHMGVITPTIVSILRGK